MEKKENKMHLPSLDDIFTTQEERDNANLVKVEDIKITDIDDFPDHPFKVLDNDEMKELVESIKEKGVILPVIVRPKENGKYEMIAGHRRKFASKLAGNETIPCIVKDLTDDEATIVMVDSNLQREKILPSEKAFAYKLKMEAISHQGKRNDLTCGQVGHKLENVKSRDIIAKNSQDSARNIQRYIRLTYLIPEFLKMVDNDSLKLSPSMAFSPAVEISYLSNDDQRYLLDIMECNDCTPSLAQAIKLKNMSLNKTLTIDDMEELMEETKPNQTPKLKVSMNRLNGILPDTLKNDADRENYVIDACTWYKKYQIKMQERKAQVR